MRRLGRFGQGVRRRLVVCLLYKGYMKKVFPPYLAGTTRLCDNLINTTSIQGSWERSS
jgi:hypothetical protein